ncbi:hypothetical protein ARZXY2_392 [Arthrobacter sp. ZXY-2]|nr:hypothetical protein ARZXY2_392 [Arthrobacter sp. ZXY-2]
MVDDSGRSVSARELGFRSQPPTGILEGRIDRPKRRILQTMVN